MPRNDDLVVSFKGKVRSARRVHRSELMRKHRDRQRRGAIVIPIEIGPDLYGFLERYGDLTLRQADDREAIGRALRRLLHRALGALVREERQR
jgi:hypothetical protein